MIHARCPQEKFGDEQLKELREICDGMRTSIDVLGEWSGAPNSPALPRLSDEG